MAPNRTMMRATSQCWSMWHHTSRESCPRPRARARSGTSMHMAYVARGTGRVARPASYGGAPRPSCHFIE